MVVVYGSANNNVATNSYTTAIIHTFEVGYISNHLPSETVAV